MIIMGNDIEKLFAHRKRELRWTAGILLFSACMMTHQFYSGESIMASMSTDECVHDFFLRQIFRGVTAGILWCFFVYCLEELRQLNFLSQLVDKIERLVIDTTDHPAEDSEEI
jgi:hypothetical protein